MIALVASFRAQQPQGQGPVALPSDREEKRGPLAGFTLCAGAIAAIALIGDQAFGQQAIAPPKVTASAVYVLNADTGQPLYRKGENKAFRILSITKLITAYVLVQRLGGQLSDAVTIHRSASCAGVDGRPSQRRRLDLGRPALRHAAGLGE
jgi:D-alanyl-D-alanine carboxypeptidase